MYSIILQHAGKPINGSNEIQLLTIGGTPTGGTFAISYGSLRTAPITWSATNGTLLANIQAALNTMLGTSVTLVAALSLTAGIGTINVTFQNARGAQAQSYLMVADGSLLTGTSPTAVITLATAGVTATGRGNGIGSEIVDNLTGNIYINVSTTALNPNWLPRGIYTFKPGSPAVASTTGVHAAVTDNGSPQTITTAITNPAVCRNITATAGGTNTDIKAISVVVTGTNINDEVITETLPAFTVDTAGTVTGSKAFKTVTSIAIPAHDGTGATTSIGFGSKIGLEYKLLSNTIQQARLGGVKEGTAPTVATSTSAVESNTATLNSALNSTAVQIDLYVPF